MRDHDMKQGTYIYLCIAAIRHKSTNKMVRTSFLFLNTLLSNEHNNTMGDRVTFADIKVVSPSWYRICQWYRL